MRSRRRVVLEQILSHLRVGDFPGDPVSKIVMNADDARRKGKSVEEVAEKTADLWRDGLAGWDITPERIQALKDSVRFAIYTPGSDAGLPISILASLAAPDIP